MPINWGLLNTNQPQEAANSFQQGQDNALKRALMQQHVETGQYAMNKARRDDEAQNALLSALKSAKTPEEIQQAYVRAGKGKEAFDMQKTQAEARFKDVEATHKMIDTAGQALGYLKDNPTLPNAMLVLDHLQTNKLMPPEKVDEYRAMVQQDPSQIARLATMGYQSALAAKDQLPKIDTRNTGGSTDTLSISPVTGKVSILNSVRNTATPGEIMTDARGRASLAQSERHHQETLGASLSKPFEVTGVDGKPLLVQQDKAGKITPVQGYGPKAGTDKPPTEFQGKSAGYGARAEEADKILTALEKDGSYSKLGAVTGGGTGITNTVLTPMMSESTQKAVQAQRDFVNAVLRQESGAAISPAEFENAKRQYFPQPGEGKSVIEQKAANRKLAIQGFMNNAGKAAFHAPVVPSTDSAGGYQDPAKEQRYQAWLKSQGR